MNKTSINATGEARELAVFLGNTLRDRGRNSPTYDADVYDRDANHPIGSIIVEGVVNLHQLAGIILDHLSDDVVDATVLDDPLDTAKKALAALNEAGVVLHDPDDTPIYADRTENMGDLNIAAFYLARHVNQAERATHIAAKEAADREALEAEALHLRNEMYGQGRENWNGMSEAKAHWTNVAKHARTMHGVTK